MISTNPAVQSSDQPVLSSEYDVIVVGAGPAGAACAALVAEFGHSVALLERSPMPRFHVGESLIPETYWTLKRLGLIEKLKESAFPKKFSVQFVTETGKESAPFYFDEHKDHESSQTWQVIRGEFDQMIVEKAVENGTVCRTDAKVLEVLFEGGTAVGVKVKLDTESDNAIREVKAKVVVDATGQSAFLVNRLGLKQADPHLKKGTVWTYYKGAQRDPGKDEGATIILQTEGKKSWFWYIPLPDDVVSIGCTGSMEYMFAKGRGDAEAIFQEEVSRCPGMQKRLANATRVHDYFTTKDFSYYSSQGAGDGWVLIGDALGFIDPVYSSGVYLAMKSAEFAADAIHEALTKNELNQQTLGGWQPEYRKGVDLFRKLVYAFYTPGFSFGHFLKDHPQYHDHLVDILIGDVFKPGVGEIFEAMGEVIPPEEMPVSS